MKAAKDAALLIAMTNEGTSKQPWHKERERERVHAVIGAVHTHLGTCGYCMLILNISVSTTRKLCLSPGKPSCISGSHFAGE